MKTIVCAGPTKQSVPPVVLRARVFDNERKRVHENEQRGHWCPVPSSNYDTD